MQLVSNEVLKSLCESAAFELLRRGISQLSSRQLLAGEIVTNFADRLKIARLIRVGKNQDIEVENDETHRTRKGRTETVDMNESIMIIGNRLHAMLYTGFSALGAQQILLGQRVTSHNDRQKLAKIVATGLFPSRNLPAHTT